MSSNPPANPTPRSYTEEEVKVNFIIPWLRKMGVTPEETSFERSFRVRLGHNQVAVGEDAKRKDQVGGRYDTLVKRNGYNLLIVEFKASDFALEDADRDQAISYARLLPQIAPYVLVTNGRDFRLYDVETMKSCEGMKLQNGYHLSLPEDQIALAQELFLNLSPENLNRFCQEQVAAHLKTLTGSATDLAKKYVPALTVPRLVLDDWVAALEAGAETGLLVFAESGRGKTSAFCDLAQRRLAAGKPTLFFSGIELEGSLLAAVADEFNWVFSEHAGHAQLLKRLGRLTTKTPLLIILDAVDEWLYPQRAPSLLAFLRGIAGMAVKVLLSCKSNAWPGFAAPGGQALGFDAFLRVDGKGSANCGKHLPDLTDAEFFEAVGRYRDVFGVRGRFETAALAEARRNPFLLRVLYSVATSSGASDVSFSLKDFFARYYELILQRTGRAEVADVQLVKLAECCDALDRPTLTKDEVRAHLGLSVSETLLSALFEQDVLLRNSAGTSFYFQHLRDYLIAFRVRRWHLMPPDEFARVTVQGVALEAFNFFLRYASAEQMRGLTGPAYANAEKYVTFYDELLGRYFPELRREFEPRESGAVGFIAEYVVTLRSLGGYGFRLRAEDEPAVLLVPVDEFFSKSNLMAIHGATSLFHSTSTGGFMAANIPREVVENEILRQMQAILLERRLSMRTTRTVPREALVAAVEGSPAYFASLYDKDQRHIQYPLSAARIRAALERVKLANHFRSEIAAEKTAALAKTSGGRFRSVSLTRDDDIEVLRRMELTMAAGTKIKFRSIVTNVRDLEEQLARLGVFDLAGEIAGSVWPNDYTLADLLHRNAAEGQRQLEQFIGEFFRAFLTDYRSVVEENFPSLKGAFAFYSDLPVRLYISVSPKLDHYNIDGNLTILGVRLPAGTDNEVVICRQGELDRTARTYRGQPIDVFMDRGIRLGRYIPWRKGGQPLHDYIYTWLTDEWAAVANVIRRDCGLPAKGPH